MQKKLDIALSHAQQVRADEEYKRDQLLQKLQELNEKKTIYELSTAKI